MHKKIDAVSCIVLETFLERQQKVRRGEGGGGRERLEEDYSGRGEVCNICSVRFPTHDHLLQHLGNFNFSDWWNCKCISPLQLYFATPSRQIFDICITLAISILGTGALLSLWVPCNSILRLLVELMRDGGKRRTAFHPVLSVFDTKELAKVNNKSNGCASGMPNLLGTIGFLF